MRVLGIHDCFDAGAALVEDGVLERAVNEERLNRIKYFHEENRRFLRVFNITTRPAFPELSIRWILESRGFHARDLDAIALIRTTPGTILARRLLRIWKSDAQMALRTLATAGYDLPNRLTSMGNIERITARRLFDLGLDPRRAPQLKVVPVTHHLAHAASALRTSGWRDALVLTTDMEGEMISTCVWSALAGRLLPQRETYYQLASAGVFYGVVTAELGFRMHQDEWKLMGLAAYGDAALLGDAFDRALYFDPRAGMLRSRLEAQRLRRLVRHLARAHRVEDIAAAAQHRLEEVFTALVAHWVALTGHARIALAGGVAHNVKMNARLRALPSVEAVHVFPHPGDGGLAAGAALEAHARMGGVPDSAMMITAHLGPEYDDAAICAAAAHAGITVDRVDDPAVRAAELLASGKIIGWFQGRMEYGPRALGARSILVHPGSAAARDRVNAAVKFREWWRPFALSVLEDDAQTVLADAAPSPFMTLGFTVNPAMRSRLAAITHIDHTTRPQTVTRAAAPRFHELLIAFKRLTGIPGLLNTSFNRASEPIVCTPADAFACYLGSGLDALVAGSFVATK